MANDVYNGFWIDFESGRVRGATLTLKQQQGLILVSFLTLYVQFAGACFWRVVCFVLHQGRSTTSPRDGLFHQQQTILRNSITAPNALWSLSRSMWAWKGNAQSPFGRTVILILITCLHIAFFGVAGLFSSQIASTGAGQALIRAGSCGYPKDIPNLRQREEVSPAQEELTTFNSVVLLGRLTLTKSVAYVRSCYNDDNDGGSADCNVFVHRFLDGRNSVSSTNATCPFGGNSCVTTTATRYDSGYLSSGRDLGMNFPESEDVTIRRVTSCAPIAAEKYATDWKDNLPEAYGGKTNTSVKFYEFGKQLILGCEATSKQARTENTTFCVSQYQKDYWTDAYTMIASTAYAGNVNASDFTPIPDFYRDDADVTLVSIFNQARYTGPVTDPLFNATISHQREGSTVEYFTATNDLSVLGCTEQYQFCNAATEKCTDLTGLYRAQDAVYRGDLSLSAQQTATFRVLWKAAWSMALQWATTILDDTMLLAQDYVFTSRSRSSTALLSTQWEREAHHLHNLSLAVLQRRVNEFASPESFEIQPGTESLDQIVPPNPDDIHTKRICEQQKIHSSAHISVSVLGMAVILIIGSVLILLDWTLIQQIFWFRSVTHHRQAKKADWLATGTLQLLRQALEARRVGPWYEGDGLFPVLAKKRTFTGLGTNVEGEAVYPLADMKGDTAYKGGKYEVLSSEAGQEGYSNSQKGSSG